MVGLPDHLTGRSELLAGAHPTCCCAHVLVEAQPEVRIFSLGLLRKNKLLAQTLGSLFVHTWMRQPRVYTRSFLTSLAYFYCS